MLEWNRVASRPIGIVYASRAWGSGMCGLACGPVVSLLMGLVGGLVRGLVWGRVHGMVCGLIMCVGLV